MIDLNEQKRFLKLLESGILPRTHSGREFDLLKAVQGSLESLERVKKLLKSLTDYEQLTPDSPHFAHCTCFKNPASSLCDCYGVEIIKTLEELK